MTNIVTPVKSDVLQMMLEESNYDKKWTRFLVDGFTNGFDIGYHGRMDMKVTAPNLKFGELGDEMTSWNKIMKEVKLKRYAGPFETIPFQHYLQSPIGLVPKDNGKDTRLIFHLSYPRGPQSTSLNANTPSELCSVKYPDFSDAVQLCLREGQGCAISRSDVQMVFRNLGIKKSQWCLLVMKARSPLDGKIKFFVDKAVPFGASRSCFLFQEVSCAVAHLVKFRTKKDNINYLDDYLFAEMVKTLCNRQVKIFIAICGQIGLPVNIDKTFWGTTVLVFLGLLIDTVNQIISIPIEKIQKGLKLLNEMLGKPSKKCTLLQLQKLCGFLNFLGRSVIPGRAFTRQLYAKTSDTNQKLKLHHHLRITSEMRRDMETWRIFLQHPTAFARPFLDFSSSFLADEIDFYTDASGKIGFGGISDLDYMFSLWDPRFLKSKRPSIEYLELFALVAGILAWIDKYRNRRVVLFCDNKSVRDMVFWGFFVFFLSGPRSILWSH